MAKKATQLRRKQPQRMCVVCREKRDKRSLTRVVRTTPDGDVILDTMGKASGRGAYLCEKPDCWDKAVKLAFLDKALKTELTEDDKERVLAGKPEAD